MASDIVGLRNITGFGWINGFMDMSSAVRLPLLLSVTLPLLVVPYLLGAEISSIVFLFAQMTMTGVLMAFFVILARGAQADLEQLGQTSRVDELEGSSDSILGESLLAVVVGTVTLMLFNRIFAGDWLGFTLIFRFSDYTAEFVGEVVFLWILCIGIYLFAFILIHVIGFCIRQVGVFERLIKSEPVDLLNPDQYQVFALQPMRCLLIVALFTSANLIVIEFLQHIASREAIIVSQIPIVAVLVLLSVLVTWPLWLIRNQLKEAKARELNLVRMAILGDRKILEDCQIAPVASEFKAPDLMQYERRISDIWEWPIQGKVQRLLVYGLLPPLAWVLAALVEQVVEAQL